MLNTHRGMGKTVLDILLIIERCLKAPGTLAYFGSATEKDAIAIFSQTMNDPILPLVPKGIRLDVQKTEASVRSLAWDDSAPDSKIFVVGLKEYAGSLRGRRAHIIVLDELREFDQSIDNVNSVVKPMFIGKDNPLLIITSTPPKMLAHPFSSYFIPRAVRRDAYCQVKGSENDDFTDDEIEKIVDDPEDKDSLEYKREIEAELVEDLEAIMFPEFVKRKGQLVEEHTRPDYFFPFMGGDLGFVDYNAVVFAYIDFEKQLLIVEDEYMNNGVSTGELAQEVRHQEVELFYHSEHFGRMRRWCDNDPQDIANLQVDFGYGWEASDKGGKEMAIADLRMSFLKGRIRINPRCKSLVYQLENAIRKEGDSAKIERVSQVRSRTDDPIIGHWDAIDALIYLHRMLKSNGAFMLNPFPYYVITTEEFLEPGEKPKRITKDRITRDTLEITRDSTLINSGERARIR